MAIDQAMLACPHCATGNKRRYRPETREWTHTIYNQSSSLMSHTICLHPPVTDGGPASATPQGQ